MKIIEKIAKKFTRTASSTVKTEVKKTAVDLLPAVLTVVTAVVGIVIFKGAVEEREQDPSPTVSNTTVTTNNYFFRDISEESIKKILED